MKKTSFLSKDDSDHKHLRFIISDEDENGEYLVVPLQSLKKRGFEDDACMLTCGDHPFIKHISWINYSYAFSITKEQLIKGINQGLFTKKEDIDSKVLLLIQTGAEKTDRLPEEFIHFFDYF